MAGMGALAHFLAPRAPPLLHDARRRPPEKQLGSFRQKRIPATPRRDLKMHGGRDRVAVNGLDPAG
jgi:hypothetical protein